MVPADAAAFRRAMFVLLGQVLCEGIGVGLGFAAVSAHGR